MKVLLLLYICFHLFLLTGEQNIVMMKELKLVTGEIGQSVALNCSVTPVEEIFYVSWTRGCGNTSLDKDHNSNRVTFRNKKLEVIIANLTEEDSGIYYCHVHSGKTISAVHGTILQVIEQPAQQGTDGDQHMKVITLYSIVVFQTCVIIVLLVVLITYCLRGTPATKDKDNEEEEARDDRELNYAVPRQKAIQHPRTRRPEDVITYAAIKAP